MADRVNIDALESVAQRALADAPDTWQQGASLDEDPSTVYSWPSTGAPVVVADCRTAALAEHVASFSPDVVLELLAEIRQHRLDKREREQDAMDRDTLD